MRKHAIEFAPKVGGCRGIYFLTNFQNGIYKLAPFGDPLYLDINGSHLAIRIETAREIEINFLSAAKDCIKK